MPWWGEHSLNAKIAFLLETQKQRKRDPLHGVLSRILSNEFFHDIKIQCSDGVVVSANRAVLSVRSVVFERMLFGKFSEATSDKVQAEYTGVIMKVVVEHIHTDETELVRACKKRGSDGSPRFTAMEVRNLFSLVEAASYYQLQVLGETAEACLMEILPYSPLLILSSCLASMNNEVTVGKLATAARRFIRRQKDGKFGPDDMCQVTQDAVEEVLGNATSRMTEHGLLEFLQHWVTSAAIRLP